MLHGIHCIQSGSIGPSCMQSIAFTQDAFHTAAWNPVHSVTLHGFLLNAVDSIGINYTKLHGIHFIQSRSIGPRCMEYTAFNRDPFNPAAWNPLHQSGCILPCCMESTAFNDTAWNLLHSLGIHLAMLHVIHCV